MNKDRLQAVSYVLPSVGAIALFVIFWLSSLYVFGGERMPEDRKGKMMDEMMSGRVPGLIPDQLPEPTSLGASLLIRYCAQCHNLPSPATHSREEWPEVVQRMNRHMSMMEGMGRRDMMRIKRPTEDENEHITQYLQSHGLKPFSADSLPFPNSSGAILFQKTCTECHVLPDIKLHTVDEWPGVVERMRMNMRVIGKRVITEGERDEIVDYLRQHTQ